MTTTEKLDTLANGARDLWKRGDLTEQELQELDDFIMTLRVMQFLLTNMVKNDNQVNPTRPNKLGNP